jgi:hypothetical protein
MDYSALTRTDRNYAPFIWAYHKKDDPPVVIEPSPEEKIEPFPPEDSTKKPKTNLESIIIPKKN